MDYSLWESEKSLDVYLVNSHLETPLSTKINYTYMTGDRIQNEIGLSFRTVFVYKGTVCPWLYLAQPDGVSNVIYLFISSHVTSGNNIY